MRITSVLILCGLVGLVAMACESTKKAAEAPESATPPAQEQEPEHAEKADKAQEPATEPDEGVPGDRYTTDEFSIVVPEGWRNSEELRFGPYQLYLNGDGISTPACDETGSPLQIGMTVEKYPNTTDSVTEGAKRLASNASRNRRLRLLGEPEIVSCTLKDGTPAALLTTQFIKEGTRRSLQMKLLAKDKDSNGWVVSGFLVGGKDSAVPTPDSEVAKTLREYMLSFRFNANKP